jgi:hypothetical protein
LHHLTPPADGELASWWLSSRLHLPETTRKGFDALWLLISWMLWKERNGRVFDGRTTTSQTLALAIRSEGNLWLQAGFRPCRAFLALVRD